MFLNVYVLVWIIFHETSKFFIFYKLKKHFKSNLHLQNIYDTFLLAYVKLRFTSLTKSFQCDANYWREQTNFDKRRKVTRFNYTFVLQ